MQVQNLCLLETPFGQALRELAMTCAAHFVKDQICKSTQVYPRFATQTKSTQVEDGDVHSLL